MLLSGGMVSRYLGIVLPFSRISWHTPLMNVKKAMTLRLTPEQAEQLETVARVDGKPIAAVIRAAIDQHIEARKQDQEFRRTLQERLTRTRKLLRG